MGDWNLDEDSISKWKYMQHCKSKMPGFCYNAWQILGIQTILSKTNGVGDTKYNI